MLVSLVRIDPVGELGAIVVDVRLIGEYTAVVRI